MNVGALVVVLGTTFVALAAIALVSDTPRGRALLRRLPGVRKLEALEGAALSSWGLASVGVGLCAFAALLTLKFVLPGAPGYAWLWAWCAPVLGVVTIGGVTLGAAMLERGQIARGA